MLFLSILNCSNLAHSSKQILIQKILIRNQKKIFKRKIQLQRPGALTKQILTQKQFQPPKKVS